MVVSLPASRLETLTTLLNFIKFQHHNLRRAFGPGVGPVGAARWVASGFSGGGEGGCGLATGGLFFGNLVGTEG